VRARLASICTIWILGEASDALKASKPRMTSPSCSTAGDARMLHA
jgi:hypothetical protein